MTPPYPFEGTARRRVTVAELRSELVEIQRVERTRKTAWRTDRELKRIEDLGIKYVDEITRAVLSRWRSSFGESVTELTIKGYYSAVRSALHYAHASGYIDRNPADALPMRFSAKKLPRKRHLSVDETRALFELLRDEAKKGWEEHRLYALTVTIFGVGLRASEGHTLQVADVDLNTGIIDLSRRPRKTQASAVPVAMPDFVSDVLARWIPECGSEWLFPHKYGRGPWVNGAVERRPLGKLQAAAKRAGIPYVTFSMGRHGWATFAESVWGLTGPQIRAHLRHTTERTSADHYRHAAATEMKPVVRLLAFPGFRAEEGLSHGTENQAHTA